MVNLALLLAAFAFACILRLLVCAGSLGLALVLEREFQELVSHRGIGQLMG